MSVDGTKVLAKASQHSAVSYERSEELIQELELEVMQLMEKAEKAESTPLEAGGKRQNGPVSKRQMEFSQNPAAGF